MPDFVRLSDEEAKQYELFERFRKKRIEFILIRTLAMSTITLADAVASELDARKREDSLLLMKLSERKVNAYSRLATCNGAIRWSSFKLLKALKNIKLDDLS